MVVRFHLRHSLQLYSVWYFKQAFCHWKIHLCFLKGEHIFQPGMLAWTWRQGVRMMVHSDGDITTQWRHFYDGRKCWVTSKSFLPSLVLWQNFISFSNVSFLIRRQKVSVRRKICNSETFGHKTESTNDFQTHRIQEGGKWYNKYQEQEHKSSHM